LNRASGSDKPRIRGDTVSVQDVLEYLTDGMTGNEVLKNFWSSAAGNCPTNLITNLLRSQHGLIGEFIQSATESLLILERPDA
jgi:hypothetical protein